MVPINNSQNIENLVKEFNKFQVHKDKSSGVIVGFAKKLQKKVFKLVHRSEYKELKYQLSEQLRGMSLIRYDDKSIRDRKTPAKTKDILRAIERYQDIVKTYQDLSQPSEVTSEKNIGSSQGVTDEKSVSIYTNPNDLGKSFTPDHLEAMTENNTANTIDSIFNFALLEIQNKNTEEKNKIIVINKHEDTTLSEETRIPETSEKIYRDIPEKEIPDKLQAIENTYSRITREIKNIEDPIFRQLQKKYQDIKTATNRSEKLSFKERQNILDMHERALSYLSSIMGKKLTHNNSNIADLGDALRPTSVAEKFSSLYDNEYTELLATVPNSEDDQPMICKMFTYITNIYEQWIQIRDSVTQSQEFAQMSYYSDITNSVENTSKQQKDKLQDIFFQKSSKDPTLKKGFILATDFFAKEVNNGHSAVVDDFVNKANQTIAAMMCQDAPLILKWPEHGSEYDKKITREFTQSGTHIDYNIWPTLYSDNGVVVLAKGVCALS